MRVRTMGLGISALLGAVFLAATPGEPTPLQPHDLLREADLQVRLVHVLCDRDLKGQGFCI